MGRVFSYEAIAAGRVPQPEDFSSARKLFVEEIQTGVDEGTIDGGFVFGSVARGTANIRSDFDALIALRDSSNRSYRAARDITQYIGNETDGKILIEPIVYPKRVLASGAHELNHVFGEHLTGEFRLVEGNDPAEYMTFPDLSPYAICADYIFQKARKLSNFYVKTNIEAVGDNGLQRMLELPNALGRKLLQLLADAGHLEQAAEASEKPAVFRQSEELFMNMGVHEDFRTLVAANDYYDETLQAAVDGTIGKKTYDDTLVELHAKMPVAIEWARQVGRAALPLFPRDLAAL